MSSPRWMRVQGTDPDVLAGEGAGGKATGLARLDQLGAAVPPAIAIFDATAASLPAAEDLLAQLGEVPLAVRSSALGEDGGQSSYAGQYESVLNVVGASALREAMLTCVASLDSSRVASYRREAGEPSGSSMSLVVQQMVQPTFAGVLFTADPTTGRRDRMVLDYVPGLGDALVDGSSDPVHVLLATDGTIIEIEAPSASQQLTSEQVRHLAREGRELADKLGHATDFEWAFDADGQLWWLQARPITALPMPLDEFDTQGVDASHLYTRCNIGEMMPGAVTPLTMSTTMRGIDYGIQAMQVAVGVQDRIDRTQRFTAFFRGHSFLNLGAFGPMVRGVAGSNPERLCRALCGRPLDEYQPGPPRPWWVRGGNGLRFGHYLWSGAAHRRQLERDLARMVVPESLDAHELYAWITDHLQVLDEAYDHHMTSSAVAGALVPALLEVLSEGKPPTVEHEAQCAALLSEGDTAGAESLDIAAGAQHLAHVVRSDPAARDVVLQSTPEAAMAWLDEADTPGAAAWRSYLERHGHRAVRELEMRQPEWREDPSPLLASLKVAVSMGDAAPRPQTDVLNRVGAVPRWLAGKARRAASGREATKSMLVAMTVVFKRAYRALARAMVAEGLLEDPDQIFFFRHEEIAEVLAGDTARCRVASQRRDALAYQTRLTFPEVFSGEGVPEDPVRPIASEDGQWVGKPVSPGCVEGPVRVVQSVADLALVSPGDILLASVVDVGWTPCFSVIAGLATEVGSAVSHGAVVAREFGVPAVVGLRGITQQLETGAWVRLDATAGTLSRCEPEA